jgi:glycosidase
MVGVRKKYIAFSTHHFEWVDAQNEAVAAYTRQAEGEHLIVINNLSGEAQEVDVALPEGTEKVREILRDEEIALEGGRLQRTLEPYEYLWLRV